MYYDYKEALKDDILQAVSDNEYEYKGLDRIDLAERLNDELWVDDSVTGNGSGSYTFNAYEAGEYVLADGMEYYSEAVEAFCTPAEEVADNFLSENWEAIDVTIRCYLLPEMIEEALDDLEEDGFFDDLDEDDLEEDEDDLEEEEESEAAEA